MTPDRRARASAALQRHCRGAILDGPEAVLLFERDFGGFVRRRPSIVCRPLDIEDLQMALRIARDWQISIATRGAGHSQYGQCIGSELVLDLRGMDGSSIDSVERTLAVGAGETWASAVALAFKQGLIPRSLTHYLGTTIAGTVSAGGLGSESWRFGPQVDNVRWAEVVTIDGERLRCGPHENRILFDAVRGGFGQCAVIVRIGYPLRQCGPRQRIRTFVYRDPRAFVEGVLIACSSPDGNRRVSGTLVAERRAPHRRAMLLFIGEEYETPDDLEILPNLAIHADLELQPHDTPVWSDDRFSGHVFFRASHGGNIIGGVNLIRPWMDHIFSSQAIVDVLHVLCHEAPRALDYGTLALTFLRRTDDPAPLLIVPDSQELLWGIGLFPEFPEADREEATLIMTEYSRLLHSFGGMRYLSGFMPFELTPCRQHYGAAWEQFRRAKRHFDPFGLLNSGFIDWNQ